jgi:hypothetical protein
MQQPKQHRQETKVILLLLLQVEGRTTKGKAIF